MRPQLSSVLNISRSRAPCRPLAVSLPMRLLDVYRSASLDGCQGVQPVFNPFRLVHSAALRRSRPPACGAAAAAGQVTPDNEIWPLTGKSSVRAYGKPVSG